MPSKSLSPARNDAARRFAKAIVERDFDDNKSRAAQALGVSQSMLSSFLLGDRGIGMKLLDGLVRYTGKTVEDVLGEERPATSSAQRTALDVALEYLGGTIGPEAVAIYRAETRDVDTSTWLPLRVGRELTRIQRELLLEDGAELAPEAGAARGRQRKKPQAVPVLLGASARRTG